MVIKNALAAVLGLAVLTACTATPESAPTTGDSAPPTTTSTTQAAVAGIDCAKAPADVVGAALQLNLKHPRQEIDGKLVTCHYDGGGAMTSVRFATGADAASFAKGKEGFGSGGQRAKDLPGFFDEAYTGSLGTGEVLVNTLAARKGPLEVVVTSGANFEQEKKLVTALFERV
ncbi:hypothetical protein ABZ816_27325 [Actinosynnema sp. NPDC047251]|uniref:Putative secreted protein n=1 Tax=Saccharothrix espanaensis (strain ATCC 51144 / DSM 44229 / JCM 9112 / NBRC 15066 / NRRL 15764) TaxID=1179773 RepID=K0JWY7_SACES|nr:hypothetical protein [Saccharothrix espanaensis]CCH28713.1 putative secreted protein [Saccharothrix espanaensis DSM 44229]